VGGWGGGSGGFIFVSDGALCAVLEVSMQIAQRSKVLPAIYKRLNALLLTYGYPTPCTPQWVVRVCEFGKNTLMNFEPQTSLAGYGVPRCTDRAPSSWEMQHTLSRELPPIGQFCVLLKPSCKRTCTPSLALDIADINLFPPTVLHPPPPPRRESWAHPQQTESHFHP